MIYILFMICCVFELQAGSIVLETKQIYLEAFPDAFNPSIIQTPEGYILSFRYCPDRQNDANSRLGLVKLDRAFQPVSDPQLLDTRFGDTQIPPHSEDGRIFYIGEKLYILYNDNPDLVAPTSHHRRDMFLAEIIENEGQFLLLPAIKLRYKARYGEQMWQKNWVPFEWEGNMMMGYSINPHEVLETDLESGFCDPVGYTKFKNNWKYGTLRGGTPALKYRDEYLAFFHSSVKKRSDASGGKKMAHYYMGAYVFAGQPPFKLQRITPKPIIGDGFYTQSDALKRVIFPGGFVIVEDLVYVVYGKDDREIWVATISIKELEAHMIYL